MFNKNVHFKCAPQITFFTFISPPKCFHYLVVSLNFSTVKATRKMWRKREATLNQEAALQESGWCLPVNQAVA